MSAKVAHRCSKEGKIASRSFVVGAGALLLGITLVVAREAGAPPPAVAAGVVAVAAGAFFLWVALARRYEIGPFELVVHMGPIRRAIPLEGIEGVMPFHRRAPSSSRTIEHLAVAYTKSGIPRVAHLTPEDPARFLEELVSRSPFLERRGDHLVRKPALAIPHSD